jgi:hypothetical protein
VRQQEEELRAALCSGRAQAHPVALLQGPLPLHLLSVEEGAGAAPRVHDGEAIRTEDQLGVDGIDVAQADLHVGLPARSQHDLALAHGERELRPVERTAGDHEGRCREAAALGIRHSPLLRKEQTGKEILAFGEDFTTGPRECQRSLTPLPPRC